MKTFIDKLKKWQFEHPARFIFAFGFVVGFIVRSLF
jgi:hypothetical protein